MEARLRADPNVALYFFRGLKCWIVERTDILIHGTLLYHLWKYLHLYRILDLHKVMYVCRIVLSHTYLLSKIMWLREVSNKHFSYYQSDHVRPVTHPDFVWSSIASLAHAIFAILSSLIHALAFSNVCSCGDLCMLDVYYDYRVTY